jgi:hypothetical protein
VPDDMALDRVQRAKVLISEQDTSSRKIDPHRKQIIQTVKQENHNLSISFGKGISHMLNYGCTFMKAYQQGST